MRQQYRIDKLPQDDLQEIIDRWLKQNAIRNAEVKEISARKTLAGQTSLGFTHCVEVRAPRKCRLPEHTIVPLNGHRVTVGRLFRDGSYVGSCPNMFI